MRASSRVKETIFLIALNVAPVVPARAASVECGACLSAASVSGKAERSIQRLQAILATNEEFMAGLDPGDESERLKARSNINIARKRIAALEAELRASRTTLAQPDCKPCLNGE